MSASSDARGVTVEFFGHACVGIESDDGRRLVLDPYAPGGLSGAIDYRPLDIGADWVAASHSHTDHAAFDEVRGAERIEEGSFGPFEVRRFEFAHDEYDGARFGGSVDMLVVEVDGERIVHASDVGESPGGSLPDALLAPDVLLAPVGGFFTAGAAQAREWTLRCAPRVVVPFHFRTPRCDLPIDGWEGFAAHFTDVVVPGESRLAVRGMLPPRGPRVVVLDPAR